MSWTQMPNKEAEAIYKAMRTLARHSTMQGQGIGRHRWRDLTCHYHALGDTYQWSHYKQANMLSDKRKIISLINIELAG